MSATEVIKQLESMPREEQRKVFAYLQEYTLGAAPSEGGPGAVSEDFKAVAEEVFNKNAELFRKLAQ
jgi:hypothetical protein